MKTTMHKDGTVSHWSVYQQQRVVRAVAVPDCELAAMPERERVRVMRHLVTER